MKTPILKYNSEIMWRTWLPDGGYEALERYVSKFLPEIHRMNHKWSFHGRFSEDFPLLDCDHNIYWYDKERGWRDETFKAKIMFSLLDSYSGFPSRVFFLKKIFFPGKYLFQEEAWSFQFEQKISGEFEQHNIYEYTTLRGLGRILDEIGVKAMDSKHPFYDIYSSRHYLGVTAQQRFDPLTSRWRGVGRKKKSFLFFGYQRKEEEFIES